MKNEISTRLSILWTLALREKANPELGTLRETQSEKNPTLRET